ncbi:isochorismatase family protein [Erythrobacter sp. NE805]|uniref:isochorismatase family protein n=1 Tax=Erythrobacter sp. NE805 TaxID=3389875 RepID=UPI00396B18E1
MVGGSPSDSYAGVFEGRLQPGTRPALLVVDVVAAYLAESSPLYMKTAAAALESNRRLAEAARGAGVPVVLTNVSYREDGSDGGVFWRKSPVLRVFTEGSPLGVFPDELADPADHVVTKQFPSAFFATGLAGMLHARGVDTLLIGGYSTSGCVRASALDAVCHGFVPLVVREACADRHSAPHEANLFDLQAKYAEVVSEAAAMAVLERAGAG